MAMLQRVIRETEVDVVLSYAHSTLLDQCLADRLLPLAADRGVGVINASAVSLGLLTPGASKITGVQHPADHQVLNAALRVKEICVDAGVDISFLANQFSIQRSGSATTLIGTVNPKNLDSAVAAVNAPIDEALLARVLDATSSIRGHDWINGLPKNN